MTPLPELTAQNVAYWDEALTALGHDKGWLIGLWNTSRFKGYGIAKREFATLWEGLREEQREALYTAFVVRRLS